MQTNTYIALTIGPIYRTFSQAKRTRMLWGASYLFSYLIRELIYELIENQKIDEKCFLLPFADEVFECRKDTSFYNGAGIFPDRFIFKSKIGDYEKVGLAIRSVLTPIAPKMADHLLNANEFRSFYKNISRTELEAEITTQLNSFFQFYYTEKVVAEGENILRSLSDDLDVAELHQQYLLNTEHNHILNFLFRVNLRKPQTKPEWNIVSFLSQDAFDGKKDFESLIEVATKGFDRGNTKAKYQEQLNKYLRNYETDINQQYDEKGNFKDEEDNQDGFLKGIKAEFKEEYRNYHKYVAVLYADGDGIGNLLKEIGDDTETIKTFSEKLIKFCKDVSNQLKSFGGSGIYLGGEDIFAFVPIASYDEAQPDVLNTIFDLIKGFDGFFDTLFDDFEPIKTNKITKPTLSYGISTTYYKFPLYESMKIAHDLLVKAKKRKADKNTIGIRVEKHSGQYYDAFIEKKNAKSYSKIIELIKDTTKSPKELQRKFINSITHRLKNNTFWTLLNKIGDNKDRLAAFFENNFNEGFFKNEPVNTYLCKLQELILEVFEEYKTEKDRKDVLYFTLRFIDFINTKDER